MIVVNTAFEVSNKAVESYWLLLGDKIVQDIIVPKQSVSFAHVRVDGESILELKSHIHAHQYKIMGWGHSHANFGVFFSGTDVRNQHRILHETHNFGIINYKKGNKTDYKSENDKSWKETGLKIPKNVFKYSYGCTLNVKEEKYAEVIWTQGESEIERKRVPVVIVDQNLTKRQIAMLDQFREEIQHLF